MDKKWYLSNVQTKPCDASVNNMQCNSVHQYNLQKIHKKCPFFILLFLLSGKYLWGGGGGWVINAMTHQKKGNLPRRILTPPLNTRKKCFTWLKGFCCILTTWVLFSIRFLMVSTLLWPTSDSPKMQTSSEES